VGEIPLYFYVPMERFFDGTHQENSKTQGGKGQIRKIKEKKERKRKEKGEIFPFVEVPILKCSPEGGSHSHKGGNLPYNLLTRYKVFKKKMVPPNLPKCRLDS